MIKDKKILAVIPARGGSKGIPNKNIVDLCGKPLIAYSIEEALKTKYIDKVIVSTDSEKIKDISLKWGADLPFMRSNELSSDSAKSIDVVLNCLEYFNNVDEYYDYVILLQPTSPLRNCKDIDDALEMIINKNGSSLVSVCPVEQNPVLMRTIENDRMNEIVNCQNDNLRRQELPEFYIFNGAIYINSVDMLYNEKAFVNENTIPYVMDKNKSIDIDEPKDIVLAEFFLRNKNE